MQYLMVTMLGIILVGLAVAEDVPMSRAPRHTIRSIHAGVTDN